MQRSITRSPYRHDILVRVAAPVADIAQLVPPNVAEVEDDAGATLMRFGADSLDWPLMHVVALGFDFEILEPPELREHAVAAAGRLMRAAGSAIPAAEPPGGAASATEGLPDLPGLHTALCPGMDH